MYAKNKQKYPSNTFRRFCKQFAVPALSGAFVLFFILAFSLLPVFPASIQQIDLVPTDDAYVVNNLNDPTDRAGLRNLNTGEFKFMKIWYAWNVTESGDEKIISLGYMKYDLSNIDAKFVESAKLQMYANITSLSGAARPVDLHLALKDKWDEQAITYGAAPVFMPQANSSASISKAGKYYSWDVTELVKQRAGSQLPLVITLRTLYENSEEQVVFYTKEADDKSKVPKLLIDYSGSIPTSLLENKASSTTQVESQDNMGMIAYGSMAGAAAAGGFAFFMYKRPRNHQSLQNQVSTSEKESQSYFCFKCGKQTMPEYNVCPYCGTDLKKQS